MTARGRTAPDTLSRFVGSRLVSVLGDGVFVVAVTFTVLDRFGGSSSAVALVVSANMVGLLTTLVFGALVSGPSVARRITVGADLGSAAIECCLIASVVLAPSLAAVVGLVFLKGCLSGLFGPAYRVITAQIGPPEVLPKANARLGTVTAVGALVGPAAGGLLVNIIGSVAALAVDSGSFVISALLVLSCRLRVVGPETCAASMAAPRSWSRVFRGVRAVRRQPWLQASILLVVVVNFVSAPLQSMGPSVTERQGGGSVAFGLILAASGLGGVLGGVTAERSKRMQDLRTTCTLFTLGGLSLVALGLGWPQPVVLPLFVLAGLVATVQGAAWVTQVQRRVQSDDLGGVFSFEALVTLGAIPLGQLLSAAAALQLSPETILVACGVAHLILISGLSSTRSLRTFPAEPAHRQLRPLDVSSPGGPDT